MLCNSFSYNPCGNWQLKQEIPARKILYPSQRTTFPEVVNQDQVSGTGQMNQETTEPILPRKERQRPAERIINDASPRKGRGREPGGVDALAEAIAAGEGALVEPGVSVDGHRLTPHLLHPNGHHDRLQLRQQTLDPHRRRRRFPLRGPGW